ncbi:MAG: hypothetical protein HPY45_13320 [Anaerolineae bacterium]|nr:hypothetical protein [Anaerolineae bacterium]
MKKAPFLITLTLLVCAACTPSTTVIQTAIAQTEAAQLSATVVPPTLMAEPTMTQTPTATPTVTASPTPTPDVRIIDLDPQKFLPKANELPLEGKYYLPGSDWMSLETNEEIISDRGVANGREYVISTGREVGWFVEYARGTRAVAMPEGVYFFVGRHSSAAGAQLAVEKYISPVEKPERGWKFSDQKADVGDTSKVYYLRRITSGGDYQISYVIDFTYRNFRVIVNCYGFEKDVTHDFCLAMAKLVLKKLEEAPLSPPPTLTPTP